MDGDAPVEGFDDIFAAVVDAGTVNVGVVDG